MLGAISGDVIGSIYERNNIKSTEFDLFSPNCRYTDDSVLTCAVAKACLKYADNKDLDEFRKNVIVQLKICGLKHINAGYGGTFIRWLLSDSLSPYNSWGNGSAMRVSPVAYIADNLDEALKLAEISADVTHNHPEGIKGAKAIASAIYLANTGADKKDIRKYIEENFYDLNFRIADARKDYRFDVSCQGSVPYAIESFLESDSFEDSLRLAISLGGDSDTIAAMSGSIAEAYYGIPKDIEKKVLSYLSDDLFEIQKEFYQMLDKKKSKIY